MESTRAANAHPAPTPAPFQHLFPLVSGYRASQAIYVVAVLGIADVRADGPKGSDELARATETNEAALYRLLRFRTGVGLFEEVGRRRVALTALGAGLRADVPGSIRPTALNVLDGVKWQAWGQLLHSVRTGETAFQHVHGLGCFDYLRTHPDAAAVFNAARTSNTAQSGEAITRA